MSRLREYRFEADTEQYQQPLFPNNAETPGRYPAIKIATKFGEFALIPFGLKEHEPSSIQSDAYHHLYEVVDLEFMKRKEKIIPRRQYSSYGLIALGNTLRSIISDPSNQDYLRGLPLGNPVNKVVFSDELIMLDRKYGKYDHEEDDYDGQNPVFAIHEDINYQPIGIQIHPLVGEDVTWETGEIVVPSLLKARYA